MVESKALTKFEVDPLEPINVREKIKPLEDKEISLRTKPSQAVQKPNSGLEKFICLFCDSIAVDPISDSNCLQCFCSACADQNLKEGAECPVPDCGDSFIRRELSSSQKKEKERIVIVCEEDDCKQEYQFNQTLEHRKICSVKKVSCVNNCGDGKLYKGLEAHLAHVMNDCCKTKVICMRCRFNCSREDFEGHNCIVGFIN